MAVDQGFSRLHPDLPEAQLHALAGQRAAHEVAVADRGAADGDENIGPFGAGALDRRLDLVEAVADDAEVERFAAGGRDQPENGESIGGHDLVGAARGAGRDQFVAGGKHGDPWLAGERQGRVVGGGGERDIGGAEAPPGAQQDRALGEIDAGVADIVARLDRRPGDEIFAVALGLFLDQHGVGAFGDRRAGENPHGLARGRRSRQNLFPPPNSPMTRNGLAASAARRA